MMSKPTTEVKQSVEDIINNYAAELIAFSHDIHSHPELSHDEIYASQSLVNHLQRIPQATVTHGINAMPTAVCAEIGGGDLLITVCAEYDALPDIGHACGHNIIAASALGAFVGLATVVDDLNLTVRLLGTPAEETDGGKIDLLKGGHFDGTHAAMMIHPSNKNEITMNAFAQAGYDVTFTGKSAHASMNPWEGINALDAMTLSLSAIGLARQQFRPGQQVHGVVTKAGSAANIIPETSSGQWMTRAKDFPALRKLETTLRRCFEAGETATGSTLTFSRTGHPFANMDSDDSLNRIFHKNMRSRGREMRLELGDPGGSTDMANISHYFPTIHPMLSIGDNGPAPHTPQFQQAAAGETADITIIDGAIAMAHTAIDIATDANERARLLNRRPKSTSEAGDELD